MWYNGGMSDTTDFKPTDEQANIVDLAADGGNVIVTARAGTGKTSTAVLVADALADRGIIYAAFNKALVTDAEGKFPANTDCRTMNSLGFRAVGHEFKHRLGGGRMPGYELAKRLGIHGFSISTDFGKKYIQEGMIASLAVATARRFCSSADHEITDFHVPMTRSKSVAIIEGWDQIRPSITTAARQVWEDWQDPSGELPYDHSAYMKLWDLRKGHIDSDVILIDEAQDVDPIQMSLMKRSMEAGAQLLVWGDPAQEVYAWRGARSALDKFATSGKPAMLSNSFRFGPEIAEVANFALEYLDEAPLVGVGPSGRVGLVEDADATLCRTNAEAVDQALSAAADGRNPHVMGGAKDVVSFARAVKSLQEGKATYHPDLLCFETWDDVLDYVRDDELGGDIQLLVKLIEKHSADTIIMWLNRQASERNADCVFATAHATKGREWGKVRLASDFPEPGLEGLSEEEVRLLYVGATRAQTELDNTNVLFFNPEAE